MAEEIEVLERKAALVVEKVEALKRKVEGLTGQATPALINTMTMNLVAVRRKADAVRMHVRSRRDHPPHIYLNSLGELAAYLDEKLRVAINHFAEVERANPSALRRSEHGIVISIPIEGLEGIERMKGIDVGGMEDGGSAHSAS